nr:NlpC/P60 family protein [Eudoraea chungangensis]
MHYGICHLSLIPIRLQAEDYEPMISQLLYGDHFKILEKRKYWSKIRDAFDKCEGWIRNDQFTTVSKEDYYKIRENKTYVSDLLSYISNEQHQLLPIIIGSSLASTKLLKHHYEGSFTTEKGPKDLFVKTAMYYLHAPYLFGGKTPFGIDASGLSQMVYKIHGYSLLRKASEQATQGEALSFIEESTPGDLAFFDTKEGEINHVGLIMKDNYIIHSFGSVRIDRLDHTGIFNTTLGKYTHKLRVIKKIV